MDVTRSEVVPAWRRLLSDGAAVTGASIVLDIRRAGDGFVVDWADSTLKALGSVGTRYLSVPQVSATDHPGLYQVLVDLGTVGGVSDVAQDSLIVTFYEVTAGPTYTPIDDERWHVLPSPITLAQVETVVLDLLLPLMGAGFDSATDSMEAIRDRGDAAWATPATVVLTDGSLTGAKIGANFVSTVQSGLATAAALATAQGNITTILGYGAPPSAAANAAAVWATATDDGLYDYGEALSRLHRRQRHPYRLLANGTLQYLNAAGNAVEASRTVTDVSGGAITAPSAGEPARASAEVDA